MLTKIISQDTSSPIVTSADCMSHSRITDTDEIPYLDGLIPAAFELVESWLNRKVHPSVVKGQLEKYRPRFMLPYAPIASIVSITAEAPNGETVTLTPDDDYRLDPVTDEMILEPVFIDHVNFVVEYNCGYGTDTQACPKAICHAVKMTVANLYENREDSVMGVSVTEVSLPVKRILRAYRIRST